MNLVAYDIVKNSRSIKTWVDIKYKRLCSVEIPFYTYYYIAKRYSLRYKTYTYYLIFTNEKVDDPIPRCVFSPKPGLIRVNLRDIWNNTRLSTKKCDEEIHLNVVDKQDDCIIYELDI